LEPQDTPAEVSTEKRIFVLDTNVLMHDPTAIFRFKEHDVFIPMMVLEELDAAKRGTSELARSARQVSRFLEDLIGDGGHAAIEAGLALPTVANAAIDYAPSGRLYLQTTAAEAQLLPSAVAGTSADNTILSVALWVSRHNPGSDVTLVSKDINLRIKAQVAGVNAEDYYNDRTLEDIDLLCRGTHEFEEAQWSRIETDAVISTEGDRIIYHVPPEVLGDVCPNEGLFSPDGKREFIARGSLDGRRVLEQALDYRGRRRSVWGINARNGEQNFALNLLMDPNVEFVSLLGVAGSGKTLLALAAGLSQCMEHKTYREIIMTRETISVGEDIGFLPGSEEEKMTPWMGALLDNLEVLAETSEGGSWGKAATSDVIQNRIKIRSLSFMRGRTFLNRYIIIDEAQNLTAKQMRTLITRAGPGTKIVCLGNIAQIDTPYLSETTSGLTFVVDRFRRWEHSGHITLFRGERSRLADYASNNL